MNRILLTGFIALSILCASAGHAGEANPKKQAKKEPSLISKGHHKNHHHKSHHHKSSSSSSDSSYASKSELERAKKELLACCGNVDQDVNSCCIRLQQGIDEILQELESDDACGEVFSIGQSDLPCTISTPGRYCLKEDVTWSTPFADAIIINTHDVELNLNMHVITMDQPIDPNFNAPTGTGIHVLPGSTRITIKNGTINGNTPVVPPIAPGIPAVPFGNFSIAFGPFQNGIVVDDSSELDILNITTSDLNIGLVSYICNSLNIRDCNFLHGIWGMAICGIDDQAALEHQVNGLNITNCTMRDHAEFGIYFLMGQQSDVKVSHIDVLNNQSDGIFWEQFGGGANLVFDYVNCSYNQGNGIHTQLYSNNAIFNNCQFSRNLRNGMGIIGTRNCVLNNCQARDNGLSQIAFLTRASDTVELNNCQVVNGGYTGNGGEIALRFDMVRNLVVNGCQVWSWGKPSIPGCDPNASINCSLNNFPAVRFEQCNNVNMVNSLVSLGFTDPTNPGNGLVVQSSEGLQFENVNVDFGFFGGLVDPTNAQANAFLVQGGVKNCVFRNCQAQGTPNNGFAVVWESDSQGNPIYNGFSGAITFENCNAVGARNAGFLIDLPGNKGIDLDAVDLGSVILLGNKAAHNNVGIQITDQTTNCSIRDNTLLSNDSFGLLDENAVVTDTKNAIYHNFGHNNGTNFSSNVQFVVLPHVGIGVLENING